MAEDENEQSTFTKPGFLAGAGLVAVLIIAGIVLTVVNVVGGDDDETASTPAPTSSASAAPSATPTAAAGGESVCGLGGEELSGTLTTAPDAEWQYQSTSAYPSSSEFGPIETAPAGYRFCFQHSPSGALFAASNAVVQAFDNPGDTAWADYFLSEGTYREALLTAPADDGAATARLNIVGYRLLSYEGETARVDVALRGSADGETVTASAVYDLVWEAGDWKADTSVAEPFSFAVIPDTSGYTLFTAGG